MIRSRSISPLETLTRRELDCLEVVQSLTSQGWPARTIDIARRMNVSAPSVVELVNKLHAKGAVVKGPGGIRVSGLGLKGLGEVQRSHRILETMLTQMGMRPETACKESRRVDRYSSREIVRAICNYLGHPSTCPHHMPIEPDPGCCKT